MIRTVFRSFNNQIQRNVIAAPTVTFQRIYHQTFVLNNNKKIDYSRVPVLNEQDLEEQMVRGSGPGGQAVNKTNNCVVLKHIPTGIIVKCHLHRMGSKNRVEARRLLVCRLDERINGENSVENQKKRLEMKKSSTSTWKRKKLDELKKQWKERENID